MAASDTSTRSLGNTPTWAYAIVCFIFISISIFLEHFIHLLTNWLKRRRKTALMEAVERLKSELMLLGFMSFLLALIQDPISKICIPPKIIYTMLPCRKLDDDTQTTAKIPSVEHMVTVITRNLTVQPNNLYDVTWRPNRLLADDDESTVPKVMDKCSSQGKVPMVSTEGIHQLHIFIFVLGAMQIVYCLLTMALCSAKMKRWKSWEKETKKIEYQVANDPNRIRFTRQTTFGRRHISSFTEISLLLWIKCFFGQFILSVAKVDYFTLRHGFISAHLSTRGKNFNFQKYIQKSLEEDFKVVVSISPLMWIIVVMCMLMNLHGWHVYTWVSYVPLVIVLVLGTKLQVVVAKMAHQINNRNSVIKGTPLVEPNDNLFWFGNPRFVLTLLHLTLFVNAFELAFFIWVTIQFGLKSCFHEHIDIIVTRVVLAVTVQVICSYITLPLYALVTQMGSQYKSKVLEEQIGKIIKQWHAKVREKRKLQQLHRSLQSQRASLPTEWSSMSRSSHNEFSSLRRASLLPSDNLHTCINEEIKEEQENVVTNGAGLHKFPSCASMTRRDAS